MNIRVEIRVKKLKRVDISDFNFLGRKAPELIFNSVSNFGPEGPKNSSGGIEGSQPYLKGTEGGKGQIGNFPEIFVKIAKKSGKSHRRRASGVIRKWGRMDLTGF